VLTIYEQGTTGGATYLGDARLAAFPPGEKRMLSHAVDAKVTVDRSSEEQHAIVKAAIAQGVMRLTRRVRQITTYRLKAASDGERSLLIEQPRLAGWSLTTPDPTHVELSADAYRIPVTLAGNKQTVITVTMERPLEETIRLLDLADDRLGVLVASNEIEPSVKRRLGSSLRGGRRSRGATPSSISLKSNVVSSSKTKSAYVTISLRSDAIRHCTSRPSTSSAKPKPRSPPCRPRLGTHQRK
jgi:hypothetical protein